jgi:hypothetical protein
MLLIFAAPLSSVTKSVIGNHSERVTQLRVARTNTAGLETVEAAIYTDRSRSEWARARPFQKVAASTTHYRLRAGTLRRYEITSGATTDEQPVGKPQILRNQLMTISIASAADPPAMTLT